METLIILGVIYFMSRKPAAQQSIVAGDVVTNTDTIPGGDVIHIGEDNIPDAPFDIGFPDVAGTYHTVDGQYYNLDDTIADGSYGVLSPGSSLTVIREGIIVDSQFMPYDDWGNPDGVPDAGSVIHGWGALAAHQ